jgi:nucleoside-diphosphate-sugar epimerase
MPSSVLILGARGRFGLAAAKAFTAAGWRVLAQVRPGASLPALAAATPGICWLPMDLNDSAALARAAQGAAVVVHALNPSAYTFKAWAAEGLPMLDASLQLARALGATLMLPGNVYNFGAAMPPLLHEGTPQVAQTIKGKIRIAMEEKMRTSGVRSVVIRAGDFFGSGQNSWFDMFLVKNISKGKMTYPGHRDVPTAWAYLPDLARTFVAVADRRASLAQFEVLHFKGYSLTGQQWLDALEPLAKEGGWVKPQGQLKLSALPWPVIRVGALVNPTWASLLEMRYLWDTPHALANDKLVLLLGTEPHTPLRLAAQNALADLGKLEQPAWHTPPPGSQSGKLLKEV